MFRNKIKENLTSPKMKIRISTKIYQMKLKYEQKLEMEQKF